MALQVPPEVWAEYTNQLDQYLDKYEAGVKQFIAENLDTSKTVEMWDLEKAEGEWDPEKHPRAPAGSPGGGKFVSTGLKQGDIVHDWTTAHPKTGMGGKFGRVSEITPEGIRINYTTKVPAGEKIPGYKVGDTVADSHGSGTVTGVDKYNIQILYDDGKTGGVSAGSAHQYLTPSKPPVVSTGGVKETGQSKFFSHEDAHENLSHAGANLTPEERTALSQWFGSSVPFHQEIAQEGKPGKQGQVLLSALNKLPPLVGRCFRAEGHGGPAAKGEMKAGDVWTQKNFYACTWKRGSYGKGSPFVYVIKSLTARDVSGISHLKNEREVITLPNTRYKVLSVESKKSKGYGYVTRVFLKELKRKS